MLLFPNVKLAIIKQLKLFALNALKTHMLLVIKQNVELAQRLSQVVIHATPKQLLKMLLFVLNALMVAMD